MPDTVLPGMVCDSPRLGAGAAEVQAAPDAAEREDVDTSGDAELARQLQEQLDEDVRQESKDEREEGEEAYDEPAQLNEGQLKTTELSYAGKLSCSMLSSTVDTSTAALSAALSTTSLCHQCGAEVLELFLDNSDMNRYCEICWRDLYGTAAHPLARVEVSELWPEDRLQQLWAENVLPGWPPVMIHSTPAISSGGEEWSTVNLRIRRETVGVHAREQNNSEGRPYSGEVLAGKYRVQRVVGEGHFTKAYLAEDLHAGGSVCVKRHRNLSVEILTDLFVVSKRMEAQDTGGVLFPRLLDAFYDLVGYTVESLIEGRNCLTVMQSDLSFFRCMRHLQCVAEGALRGLEALDRAGVVHNDVKPDNLIWTEAITGDGGSCSSTSCVKIVDFGCARLDMREEPPGRNWSLAEGGAGHLGKWSPEMALRLPITHKGDVWGVAISVCELHVGRFMWRNEGDTAEVIVAQAIGLCNLHGGLPPSLMRRSPLDVRQLYTPAPRHFPVRQNALGQLEALRPSRWGLEQVLGDGWRTNHKAKLGAFLERTLKVDPVHRPCAADLLEHTVFACDEPAPIAAADRELLDGPVTQMLESVPVSLTDSGVNLADGESMDVPPSPDGERIDSDIKVGGTGCNEQNGDADLA